MRPDHLLPEGPDAVRAARRVVADELRGTPAEESEADAALVATELVTNAHLHGSPPVRLRVGVHGAQVRLEVSDSSWLAPVRTTAAEETMTGRGLEIVEAFTTQWGVQQDAHGKTVWAEVGPISAELEAPSTPPMAQGERAAEEWVPADRPTVELGDVPTDLLLAAKAHVDNVIREFALVRNGASTGVSAAVSRDLASLIERVTTRFSEARHSIKLQAIAAREAGQDRTQLRLRLPLTAAEAGREYLAALDEVDSYARAARLLTLETPPQHRAFRRWYVGGLIEQLAAIEQGRERPPHLSFERFLLEELETLTEARRAADRAASLQSVTAVLAVAESGKEIAEVIVSQGVRTLGASAGALLVESGDTLALLGAVGYTQRYIDDVRRLGPVADLPAAGALRSGVAAWLESAEQAYATYPLLRQVEPGIVSLCAVPLVLANRVRAVLRLSFSTPRLFDAEERSFVLAFAALAVQALDRGMLHDAERAATEARQLAARQLSRVHHVTAALAAAADVHEISSVVAAEASQTLGASTSALCLLEEDNLRVVHVYGADPKVSERWASLPLDADLPVAEAVRTNAPVVLASRAELVERYPELAAEVSREGSVAAVPLSAGDRRLGALLLSFEPDHLVDDVEVDLLVTIARQCALALERARLLEAERAARARATFLADATSRLAASLDPAETLQQLTDLLVPRLGDWAVVYLVDEQDSVRPATAAHRDHAVTARLRLLQQQHPPDLESEGGIGEVLRTGRSIRYGRVPESVRTRLVDQVEAEDLPALAPRSGLVVALSGAGRTRGVVALARIEDSPYTEDDLQLVEAIAERASVAMDNAELYRRERDAAIMLQRSLLPQVMPHIPDLRIAWRYLPGAVGTHVGGDWYDVIGLESNRLALVIGDVMGHGLRAAALMGQLRAAARAHVFADLGPADVLARMDTELASLDEEQIATVLLAVLDPDACEMTLASAGHLPPLVTQPSEPPSYLDVVPGPPLGTLTGGHAEIRVKLPPESTMLLYTDGLVENRLLPVAEGMGRLATAVSDTTDPELACNRALSILDRDARHEDDVAVLAVALCRSERSPQQ